MRYLRDKHMRPIIARFGMGVLFMFAMIAGPGLYGTATSANRAVPDLDNVSGPTNVQVEVSFKPQTFHRQQLSRHGVFGGMSGRSIRLFNVTPADLEALRHIYWIHSIHPSSRR